MSMPLHPPRRKSPNPPWAAVAKNPGDAGAVAPANQNPLNCRKAWPFLRTAAKVVTSLPLNHQQSCVPPPRVQIARPQP